MPTFPLSEFRKLYPEFDAITDDQLLAFASQALCFVSIYGCECSEQLWILMVAHMLKLKVNEAAGAGGQVSSASIDGVSVSFSVPPSADAWSYWLNGTPFGQMFAALSKRCNSGGAYVGGSPERAAFRGVGGGFGGRRYGR